jgi:hypothetical protein
LETEQHPKEKPRTKKKMAARRRAARGGLRAAAAAAAPLLLLLALPAAAQRADDYISLSSKDVPARPTDTGAPLQHHHFPLLSSSGLEAVNPYLDDKPGVDVSPLLGPACGAANAPRPADGMCADYVSAFAGLAAVPAAAFGYGTSEDNGVEYDAAGTAAAGGVFEMAAAGSGGGKASSSSPAAPLLLLGITDRGPSVRCGWLPGGAARVPRRLRESVAFAAPKFSPSLVLAGLNRETGRAELLGSCFLRAPATAANGGSSKSSSSSLVPVTGLPNLPGHSEEPAAWDERDGSAGASTCRALAADGHDDAADDSDDGANRRAFPPSSPSFFPQGYNVRGMDTADVKPLGWGLNAATAPKPGKNQKLCLVAEQDAPSLALVSCDFADAARCGTVLRRWVPKSVPGNLQYPQTDKALPVQPLLPRLFGLRRDGRGLRAVAVSPSGRRAVALLGGSIGTSPHGFGEAGASHLVYAVDLDLSDSDKPALAGVYAYAAEWADVDGAVAREWGAVPGARPADVTVGGAEWAGQFCRASSSSSSSSLSEDLSERPVLLVSEYVAIPAEVGGRPGSGTAAYGTAAAAAAPGGAQAAVLRAGAGQSKLFLADFGAATNLAADSALLNAVESGEVDSLFSRTLVAERDYNKALEAVRARYGVRVATKTAEPLLDSSDAASRVGGDAPGARAATSAGFDARQEGVAAVNDCWVARGAESGYGMGGAPPGAVSLVQLGTCLSQACGQLLSAARAA